LNTSEIVGMAMTIVQIVV